MHSVDLQAQSHLPKIILNGVCFMTVNVQMYYETEQNAGYCTRVGTFGTESAVRKRGGSRNLPYLNAKPRQIPLLDTYACTVTNAV